MFITLLSHGFKHFFRSSSAGKEIAVQITVAVIALLIAGYSLAAGFALEMILVKGLKQSNPIVFLNGLLVYYFIGEFLTRYILQSLPVLDARPYLHLPIARSRIVNFALAKSLVHYLNIYVFLLFAPFALTVVAKAYGMSQGWVWLLSIWFLSLTNHFILILFKRKLSQNLSGLLAFMVVVGLLAASDYFGWFRLSAVSEIAFGTVLHGYSSVVALFLWVVAFYAITYRFFIYGLYLEDLSVEKSYNFDSANWIFLQKFGLIGTWIKIHLKMIFRHKRTRDVFLMNLFFFLYVLVFFKLTKNHSAYGYLLLIAILGSGNFVINYGQFMFSWQARHFDFTLTQPTSLRLFVESKYWLVASMAGLWFLFSIPFVFFGWSILLINFVCTLFNIGINIFVVMNMAMWSPTRIDLTRGATFNLEGMGAAQWVLGIPVFLGPYIFYIPLSLAGYPIFGLVAVGLAGLLGLLFRKKLIDITSRRLFNMRYAIASNFRKD